MIFPETKHTVAHVNGFLEPVDNRAIKKIQLRPLFSHTYSGLG